MRFERLTLAPYGRFDNRELAFRPEAPLHVLFGPNEAGKTTALSAIADLLFGFPTQTDYGFAHDMRNLRVGAALRWADGTAFELRRRKGLKNTLVDASDKPIDEAPLLRALGAVDRKAFTTEFGLTAPALRSGGEALLRAGGELAQTLAASSARMSALNRLGADLAGQADDLFTLRRSAGKPFYGALDRYDAAVRRLREESITADALREAQQAVLQAKARENELAQQREEDSRVLAKFKRAQRTRGRLARLDALAFELAALPARPAFDAASQAAARAALAAARDGRAELERLAAEDADDARAVEALSVDETALARAGAIEALYRRIGAVEKAAADLPRRQEARHAALSALDDLARRLGLGESDALLAASPTDPALGRARALIEARRRAEERCEDAREKRGRAVSELERLGALADVATEDPEPFRRRLDAMVDLAAQSDALRRERATIASDMRAREEAGGRLGLSPEDIERLARAALPDEAEISAHARREAASDQALGAARSASEQARRDLADAEAELARRAGGGAALATADLVEARARRDRALARLGDSLDGPASDRRERFETLHPLVAAADAVSDILLGDSERAARWQGAREAMADKRAAQERAEEALAAAEAERAASQAEWKALWEPLGLRARAPAEMTKWRDRFAALMKLRDELATRHAQAGALAALVESGRLDLVRLIHENGGAWEPSASFEAALREARALLQMREEAWRRTREIVIARGRAERDVAQADADLARETGALQQILRDWPAAMQGLSLAPDAVAEEARAAIELWGQAPLHRLTLQRETRSVEGIEHDLAQFASEVAALVADTRPDLTGERPEQALVRLHAAMVEARRASEQRDGLLRQRERRTGLRERARTRLDAAEREIGEALRRLGVGDEAGLLSALADIERRAQLEADRGAVRDDLLDVADGLDETQLRAEHAGVDFDLLAGHIEALEARLAQNLADIGAAAAASGAAERRLAELSAGRDAAGAARDRAEAGGELVDIAERWWLRQAAARLAARVIERHRAASQDPVMARAGEYFALATGGAFAGLGADYDDSDRPVLKAIRASGEKVEVAGLSEGARDQLFLALRLALLDRRAGEPLPFIGDDILASFDDERTRCTLSLLADFGRRQQAILFTHHRHVADLARAAGADVIAL